MGKPWISGWLNLMGDFLFPGNCPVCGDAPFADPGSYACRECMDRIAWIRGNGCRICGLPMWGMGFGGLTCRACREDPPVFQSGRCLFLLDETGKKVIHEIKYHGVRPVLRDLPHWLERTPGALEFLEGCDLVPVPLHRKRLRARGFNQSVWIARALSEAVGGKPRVREALRRISDTPTQTSLDRETRKANVKDAFALCSRSPIDEQSPIVLVDDVYTTGATLDSCARVLVEGGCRVVKFLALGRG